MKKIIISDAVDKKSAALFVSAGYEVNYVPGIPEDELIKIIGDYNALIVRSETRVNAALISRMEKMELIGRAGAGVDNIDVQAATRKGILVMNTPGGNTISAAEHTVALMLAMCRNIPQATQSLREGKWERKNFKGIELEGKTLGIIGLGKIGREVSRRCLSFGMEIIGYDPLLSAEAALKFGIKIVDLNTLFAKSDLITLHVPLTPETKHLISKETLRKCKDGVRIINCSRGGIVSEEDLLEAINSGKVSGAALDVFESEPPGKTDLVSNHNIVITPHLGASTVEAQEKVAVQIAEQILAYFNYGTVSGGVNADFLTYISGDEAQDYIVLAEKIGKLQSQFSKGRHLKSIDLYFSGSILYNIIPVLKSSFLKGFLSELRSDQVNLINAAVIAGESGIKVNEIKSEENSPYTSLFKSTVQGRSASIEVSGTVFGKGEYRIVNIDGFTVELKPFGNFIIYRNEDRAGMLASVVRIFAEANINIGTASLGRKEVQKEALTIISIDSKIDTEIFHRISGMEGIKDVLAVEF